MDDEQAILKLAEALANFTNAVNMSFGMCLQSFENRSENVMIAKRFRPQYGTVYKNYNYILVAKRNRPYQRRAYC